MPAPRPPIELSYTHSKDLRCAQRFQELVLLRGDENDFEESVFGSVHHEAAGIYGVELAEANRATDHIRYDEIIDMLTADFSVSARAEIIEVSNAFRECYVQATGADLHLFEKRIAVKWPSLEPCDPSLPLEQTGDRIAGTPDHTWFTENMTRADLEDYKFGKGRKVSYDSAGGDKQLRTYCWLTKLNYPTLQFVNGRLWTVQWGMDATSSFEYGPHNIGGLHEDMVEDYGADFARADELWAEHGAGPWPAQGGRDVCRWCKLACRKYAQYLQSYRTRGVEEAPDAA